MHGKVKLTRRQIKEDKFATFMLTAKSRLEENWQYYVIGLAAVILAIVAVVYYMSSSKSTKVEAGQKYSQALSDYRSGNNQVALLALSKLVDDNSDEPTTRQALFMLGKINLETKNYSEATRYFEQFNSKYQSDKLLAAASLAGIAACDENQGQFAAAAAKYTEAVGFYADGPSQGDYLMSAMRCYLLGGDMEKAKSSLSVIKDKYKGTELALRAERFFAEKGSYTSGS